MEKIKKYSVAGMFYSASKEELLSQLKTFKENNKKDYTIETKAIIVPHAGYYYSGQLASEGYQYLNKQVKNIFIIAPAHQVAVNDVAIADYDKWETPLGEISTNKAIIDEIKKTFDCEYFNEAFEKEHAIEVQIPFIQYYLDDVRIVPILISGDNYKILKQIIDYFWKDEENAFVISSDLSHFHSYVDAKAIDNLTAEMIETQNIEKFHNQQACGAKGICAITRFALEKEFSLIRIGMLNSGDITGEKNKVVGYGSWFLYENSKNYFIKEYFSDLSLQICKDSIDYALNNNKKIDIKKFDNIPSVFDEFGACFVTLEKEGRLRGCIGSIIAHRPLIQDLVENAYSASFKDSRFHPLQLSELDKLTISISLLSYPEKMEFEDEPELLDEMRPFVDGIIIRDGQKQAVYLPSVWEQLPDKTEFLRSLRLKAGMPSDYWSAHFEAYKFTVEYITNKKD